MLTYTDLRLAFLKLGLAHTPVVAHASLRAFGDIVGGAEVLLRATTDSVWSLVMPTFTYRTIVTPEVGPPGNGLVYGSDRDLNRMAEPFTPDMPADRQMGVLAETLRLQPRARRTTHPILSFAGVNADRLLTAQSHSDPLGIFAALDDADGWILLLGVDHTVDTAIHFAEKLAGRRQFLRWALLPDRIIECPGFPGDSAGFGPIALDLVNDVRQVRVGSALVQAVPIRAIIRVVGMQLKNDPLALLCSRPDCLRCNAVRESVGIPPSGRLAVVPDAGSPG